MKENKDFKAVLAIEGIQSQPGYVKLKRLFLFKNFFFSF